MEYFAKLRNLRDKLEAIEIQLERLAKEHSKPLESVVDDFNNIYHEFTSQYHKPNRLVVEVIN